jgi:hypothetical protein
VDDAKVVTKEISMPTEMPSVLGNLVDGNSEKSIRSYLERPLIVQQGDLTSTDTATTFSYVDCLGLTSIDDMWKEKLKGFLGFKADIEYTLVVNATRFQQGRYMLCFVPTCGGAARSANQLAAFQHLHTANLTCRTQLHHVELDINCDTTAKLTVPYCMPLNSYPLNAIGTVGSYDIGSVRLFPYVAASSTCTYTLWARFKNIEFYGAALPQSGRLKSRKSTQEVERDSAGIGPIAGTLRKISSAAGELGRIPLLSSFTSPVSFVADVLANSAQIFGWSKPNILNPQCLMLKDKMRYATTYDGSSTAAPLSMSGKNELQGVAVVTDLDEMSWDYIKSIPAYYSSFTFSTTDEQAANLYNFGLGYELSVSNTFGVQDTVTFLPCTLPSIYFNKARGGFVLTIKCVKTEFHSGRVQMSVIPYAGLNTTPPAYTADDSAYLHRAIIDVREGNQWSFEIPYQSVCQWRADGDNAELLANVRFDVLDKLVAPAAVSSSITFLVEISGAADLEYAMPRSTTYQPVAPVVIQSGCLKFTDPVGAAPTATQSVQPAAYCMGEAFTSFRQLLKRVNVVSYNDTLAGGAYTTVVPFAWSTNVALPAGATGSTTSMDVYTLLSSMFGMVRGSIRVGFALINNPNTADRGCLVYTSQLVGGTSYDTPVTSAATDNYSRADPTFVGSSLTHFAELDSNLVTGYVQVPGYYSCPAAATLDTMVTTATLYNAAYPDSETTAPGICVNYKGLPYTTNTPTFIRAGADDMSFQMFISTTPLMSVASAGDY